MRLLCIGYALPDAAIDNYNVFTAPSYSDYDALLVDPASITRSAKQLVEEGLAFDAYDDRPIINAPTTATSIGAADQLRRRLDETRRLLEAGGTVMVITRPDAVQGGVFGFEGCDRYSWLPAPGGLAWGMPYIRAAEGKTVRIIAEDHPAAGVLRDFRKEVAYRATLDDRQPELRKHARFIAAGGSGIPIAAEFQVLGGRVLFLPAFTEGVGGNRPQLASALVDLCKRLDAHTVPVEPPYWARSAEIPGLEEIEKELEAADAVAAEAEATATAVRERRDALARHRRLLFEGGAAFASAVSESLGMIGFSVTSGPGEPLTIVSEGVTAFVENESSQQQVVEWPYVRLQRRLEDHLLKTSEQMKGVVVVNGKRESAPEYREEQFTEALRVACENYRYSLVTAETLFALMQKILGGLDDAALLGVRRRLMKGAGLMTVDDLLNEPEPSPSAETIF